jgi:DNA (cytosine-5)-methyltransferase 1
MNRKLKFIDLFAGIGAFHIALERLGHECVFASELSDELRELYYKNHDMKCHGDITKTDLKSIPEHDILCAGFPCQSFSKAGNQRGMQEARGKLFDEIIKILSYHKPRYILLENVRNLLTHDKGYTWEYISNELSKLGYYIDKRILSPHHINIPHHRERIFIIGSLNISDIENMEWVEKNDSKTSVDKILSHNINKSDLGSDKIEVLKIWNKFIKDLPTDVHPYSPLWTMEFGANYPVNINWGAFTLEDWQEYRGNFGYPLSKCNSLEEVFQNLPNYVRTQKNIPPLWKQRFIKNNREFYDKNKRFIEKSTIAAIKNLEQESWRKFEWNCKGSNKDFSDKLIQFRGSGVRIKRNDYIPSLVTVSTQIPIIGKYMRYILPEEGAKTQSLPNNIKLPSTKSGSFRVLGNMVNVELVYRIASALLINSNETISSEILEEVTL